jgi:uncharacterized protein (TIGR03435 family)
MLKRAVVAVWIIFVLVLGAQVPQEPLSFEAASIKPCIGQTRNYTRGGPGTSDPGQITYFNLTLRDLIQKAYGVRQYQIKGGSSWLDSERFEVIAKVPAGAKREDVNLMLQQLLAERFKLAVHRETKVLPNYNLVVDKGGPKLKRAHNPEPATGGVEDSSPPQIVPGPLPRPLAVSGKGVAVLMNAGRMMIVANSVPMSALADALASYGDRPVQDSTGLTGKYDFSIGFASPGGIPPLPLGPAGECMMCKPDEEPPPSLFAALKELGLKLESGTGPVDLIVIDRVEKSPTQN